MVRGNQESDCVSYVIRMSMDAMKSPMENVHEVSGIVGKETRILGLLIERFMPFYALPKPPSLDKISSIYFFIYIFYKLYSISIAVLFMLYAVTCEHMLYLLLSFLYFIYLLPSI